MEDGLRTVGNGGCEVWPLPGDPTCAGIARRMYRRIANSLSLDPALIEDGVTIVSELSANTLHVRGQTSRGGPELWLYLRGAGASRELVCKVFDAYPGWLDRAPGGCSQVPSDALSGRGLAVVHELSGGHWGYHLTRARLGGWHVRGKAVWFAMPVTAPGTYAGTAGDTGIPGTGLAGTGLAGTGTAGGARATGKTAGEAMAELEAGLASRGFGAALVRADDRAADMAVLSVCNGITVWCAAGAAWLRAPGTSGRRWGYGDLVELAEQTVEAYETAAITRPMAQVAILSGA
jgi:hypothetical protein